MVAGYLAIIKYKNLEDEMKKRIVAVTLSVLLLFSTIVWAAGVNGDYKGFPIVNVKINGETVTSDVPAVKFFGRTVLPVRAIAESLGAIVKWDEETATANLFKPNISMLIAENAEFSSDKELNVQNIYGLLGYSSEARYIEFDLYVESDPLPAGSYEYRTIVLDPSGNMVYTTPIEFYTAEEEDYGLVSIISCTDFACAAEGDYTFEFQMKQDGQFCTVYTKLVPVVKF
jgi:hypothetical protein